MIDLFDYAEARDRAREGAERAAAASGDEWQDTAAEFVRGWLQTHATLFVDDLWAAGLPEPKSPRALGAVLQMAIREKWMEEQRTADGYVAARPSTRSNGQLKRVWRSLLH